ncbi:MAG: glycosyltransferase family 2 protein [Verrucomicrobiae bacterium]|nr:glycosyltransferase family 2 protein [Verrucomicrobiae bacterium]
MDTSLPIAVLIPAYLAENSIAEIVKQSLIWTSEVWVGDDGSSDQTFFCAKEAGARVIRFEKNRGKGAMLRALFDEVKTNGKNIDAVITLDADGQHDPRWIPNFWEQHLKWPGTLLIGNRKGSMPWMRYGANRLSSLTLSALCGQWVPDSQCGMRLIPMEILEKVEKTVTPRFVMETEFLWKAIKQGFSVRSVPITTHYHENWSSHFQSLRDSWEIANYLVRQLSMRLINH